MASPRLTLVAVVLLLAAFTLTEAMRGFGPKKCCSRFNKKPLRADRVQGYVMTSQQCPRPGVIFTTANGQKVCAKPSEAWVKKIIGHLDAKAGKNVNL
ncbi:C-C motif chemokine 3-like [Nelusetta ayraudi]|uniref:C-C motif chemokine 3-like n=1 Tax=Nelusetta ayraudi TaxID=303726 RepID=UPI003F6EC213